MSEGFRTTLAYLLGLCLWVITASAQVNTADILGTVSDTGGAVLPNAKVTVQNLATNEAKTATTNAAGDPGQYTITVEAPSFKKSLVNLTVSAGDRARANVELQVGDVALHIRPESAGLHHAMEYDDPEAIWRERRECGVCRSGRPALAIRS
jgi:hypothetical protein